MGNPWLRTSTRKLIISYCCSLCLSSNLLSEADIAAVAVSCRRLNPVAEDALYTRNRGYGSSAVCWAARRGSIATLDKAFKYGQVVDERNWSYKTECGPLQIAVLSGQDSAVSWLLDHGADITQRVSRRCRCQLMGRETCILHIAFCCGFDSTAEILISRGAPLEYPSNLPYIQGIRTTSALLEASFNGLDAIVESLVRDYGMSPQKAGGPWYLHALTWAAMSHQNVSTVRTLVGLGANVNGLHSDWDSSPLHAAIEQGNFAVAHTLLDLGAGTRSYDYVAYVDINSQDEVDERPFRSRLRYPDVAPLHDTIASIYYRERSPTQWIHGRSVEKPSLELWRVERDRFLKRLLELGLDINAELVGAWACQQWGPSSPLDLAIGIEDTLVHDMETLITAGAEVKPRMVHMAWLNSEQNAEESTKKMRLLLKHGGRLDQPVKDGSSTLRLAAARADEIQQTSGLHEILLLASPKSLPGEHLDEVLAECLANCGWYSSTVLVRHGARVSCEDKLFSIASTIAEELEPETEMDNLHGFGHEGVTNPEPGPHDCVKFIIDMGLSSEDQCLIFQDILRKSLLPLVHLFLDRGLARKPEAAVYLPAFLMLATAWGNICVTKRLWRCAHEGLNAAFRYSIVQEAIISGHRELVSFYMEHGATVFQHLTPSQASRQRQMRKDAVDAQIAALRRLEASSDGLAERREHKRTRLLTTTHGVSGHAETYLLPFLSPLQLAVQHGHVDIIGDLLEHATQSDRDAMTACGKVYIPCVLSRANEILEILENKGIDCGSNQ